MKPHDNESFESWTRRVQLFELGRALQQLANGKDIDLIMNEMAYRIGEKLLNPLYKQAYLQAKLTLDNQIDTISD